MSFENLDKKRRLEIIKDKEKYHFSEAILDLGRYSLINLLNWQQLLETGEYLNNCLSDNAHDVYKEKSLSKIEKNKLMVLVLRNKESGVVDYSITYEPKKKRVLSVEKIDYKKIYFEDNLPVLRALNEFNKIFSINSFEKEFLHPKEEIKNDELLVERGVIKISEYNQERDGLIFSKKEITVPDYISDDKLLEISLLKNNINFDLTNLNKDKKRKIKKWKSNIIDNGDEFYFFNLVEVGDLYFDNIQELKSDKLIYAKNIFLENVKKIFLPEIKKISSLSALRVIKLNLPKLKEIEAYCWINSVVEYNLSSLERAGDLKNLKIENFYLPKLNYMNKFVLNSKNINLPELKTINHSLVAPKAEKIYLSNKIGGNYKEFKVNLDTEIYPKDIIDKTKLIRKKIN